MRCLVTFFLVGALAGCSPERGMEALAVLRDISAGPSPDASRPVPTRETVRYTARGKPKIADLYHLPDVRAGLVLVPGAARGGKDDPRLVAFAQAMARARFAVLVPDIANLRELKVTAGDADEVSDAIAYLSARTRGAARRDVGVVAISYAAGPAVLAALAPESRDKVRFVLAIGGYHDLTATITFFTTGHYRESASDKWRHRTPNAYGKWVFVRSNADRLDDPSDRIAIAAMAERKLANLNAPIQDLVDGLRAEGRSIHALLSNPDPDKAAALIAGLPRAVRGDIAALDLARRDLAPLKARLYLVHGRDDPIIPHTESMALAGAAGPDRASLYVVDSLRHVDLGPSGIGDTYTLWSAIYDMLGERDTMAPVDVRKARQPG